MTRINVGIHPSELPDKLLLAEHREIKRIPNVVKSQKYSLTGQPSRFTLGTGHVKFFYDKLSYLFDRYVSIYNECVRRQFNIQDYSGAWDDIPIKMMGQYTESQTDRSIVLERILSKGFVLRVVQESNQ